MTELGKDSIDTIKQVSEAKRKAVGKAGLRRADDGSIADDRYRGMKIPESKKEFDDVNKCNCDCHENGKVDCMECYDHPRHLKASRTFIANRDNQSIPEEPQVFIDADVDIGT